MEITNKIKQTIFAQYVNSCKIEMNKFGSDEDVPTGEKSREIEDFDNIILSILMDEDAFETYEPKLVLKPKSTSENQMAFDEEDYLSFKKIESITGELLKDAVGKDDFISKMTISSFLSYQYCVSRGIDLPQYFLDGKTLQEAGLAIYEN